MRRWTNVDLSCSPASMELRRLRRRALPDIFPCILHRCCWAKSQLAAMRCRVGKYELCPDPHPRPRDAACPTPPSLIFERSRDRPTDAADAMRCDPGQLHHQLGSGRAAAAGAEATERERVRVLRLTEGRHRARAGGRKSMQGGQALRCCLCACVRTRVGAGVVCCACPCPCLPA